jgi:hypothetical protein
MARDTPSWKGRGITLLSALVLVGSTAASYAIVSAWWPRAPQPLTASDIKGSDPALTPVNPFAAANGTNLIVYFFTSSTCGWSKILDQGEAIRSLRTQIRSAHGASYAQITMVGVGLDRDLGTGLQFLGKLGQGDIAKAFDQVIVGGSWLNEQIVKLVWREGTIEAAMPQILVVERPVDTRDYVATSKIVLRDDRVVANVVGEVAITKWMKEGTPIPQGPVARAASGDARAGLTSVGSSRQ